MSTPLYHTAFLKSGNMHYIAIATPDNHLVAYASLSQDGLFLEVGSPVAHPQFGTLLYQSLAKYAGHNGLAIMSDRDGDTRSPAMEKWNALYDSIHPSRRIIVPEALNFEVNEILHDEDAIALRYAYSLPADKAFVDSLIDVTTSPKGGVFLDLFSQGREWFSDCYENDSNKWLDQHHPLPASHQFPAYPQLATVAIDALCVDQATMNVLLQDIKAKEYSRSDGPIEVGYDIEGDLVFIDGHHRFFEALLMGEKHIEVSIELNENLTGREPDMDHPDKRFPWQAKPEQRFGGLESLCSPDELNVLQAKYCHEKGLALPVRDTLEPTDKDLRTPTLADKVTGSLRPALRQR